MQTIRGQLAMWYALAMGATLAGLVDFSIAVVVLGGMMAWYRYVPGAGLLLFPFLVAVTFLLATGVGLLLSALNVQYRDVRYVIPFLVQVWLFVTPVIYPVSLAGRYGWLLYLNPMAGIIEGFRACILGHKPIPWSPIGISVLLTLLLFMAGSIYFHRMERQFADVV